MDLTLDPALAVGFMLVVGRVGGIVAMSPLFPKSFPMVARVGAVLALSLFFTEPVPAALVSMPAMVGMMLVNIAVGLTIGWVTAIPFSIFAVGGGMLDITSGLGISSVIDPNQNTNAALFSRTFNLAALMIFLVIGGDKIMLHGIGLTIEMIPLDGTISLSAGFVPWIVESTRIMIIAGLELVIAPMGALFLAEIVLGLASRFAPTANVFMLGLPLRIVIVLTLSSVTLAMFPGAADTMTREIRESIVAGLRGLGVTA